jgi:hypothetical protein
MEVEISSNVKFFKLHMRGREAIRWGNIRAFKSLISQSTVEIFLAHNHKGRRPLLPNDAGVHLPEKSR